MDSPIRKQQKRNDYLRHKLFRKINRRRKAEKEQALKAPEKELKRRLKRPRYDDGKEELIELPEVRVDEEGNVVADDGRRGTIRLENVVVKPDHNVRDAVDRYFDKLSRRSERAWYTNPITGESYMPKGGPLESVYPEFDLITLGQMGSPLLKAGYRRILQNRVPSLGNPTVNAKISEIPIRDINVGTTVSPTPKYTDLLQRENLGIYLDEGGESVVYTNNNFPEQVLKEKEGLFAAPKDFEELEARISKDLLQNRLPNTVPLQYVGYTHEPEVVKILKDGTVFKKRYDHFNPVYSQKRITPVKDVADPWHMIFKGQRSKYNLSDQYLQELEHLGYIQNKDGFWNVRGFPYNIGDLGPNNVGYDDFGNMLIFDPLIHYNSGKDSGIHINPKNRGKFNALKKRTGKTTEQLTHSKNPLTRKRAIFAQNAAKWRKK